MNKEELITWFEIDIAAIQHNVRAIQQLTEKPVMAVIKANGYGHGMKETAIAAVDAGAAWLGVARVEEALILRQSGIERPILVLGHTPAAVIPAAAAADIRVTIHQMGLAKIFAEAAGEKNLKIHAKVDSGMGRLGVFVDQGMNLVHEILNFRNLEFEGIFTHMARADEPEQPTTTRQLDLFNTLISNLENEKIRPKVVHAANSAAALNFSAASYDLIRPGIAIYGLNPSPETPLPPQFKAALSWKTTLVSIKQFEAGCGISYGHRYFTSHAERIGVIPVGYADGFRRTQGNQVLIRGKKVPVLGSICMDQCMISLDEVPEACAGDEVVIIGEQGGTKITADDLAAQWGTINYEVVCGLSTRVPRIYFEDGPEF